jgi:hypothetical protein
MKLFTRTSLVAIAMLSFAGFLSAQTVNQGAWMLGGSVGFSSLKVKDAENSTTYFNLSPNVGYYIIDDLAIGARINFLSISEDGDSESNFGFGPFVRYYVTDPIFLQVGYDLEAAVLDWNLFLGGEGSTLHAAVGYSWFLNSGVAIEPSLYLNLYSGDGDFDADYTRFGLNVGVQAFAGRN